MLVSIFKNVTDVSNPFQKELSYCLDRIKNGNSKGKIEYLRTLPEEKYNKEKRMLPLVTFNGTFSHRSDKSIIERSGLIILDFDKFKTSERAEDWKAYLKEDNFIYSAWISPSGKGVKALVKIDVKQSHKGFFLSLENRFKEALSDYIYDDVKIWDMSGKDLSRSCFESYDKDLWINEEAETFLQNEPPEIEDLSPATVLIPMKSDSTIIRNLSTWWNKKYGLTEGSKNTNLYILAAAFNDYGIEQSVAEVELNAIVNDSSKDKELEALIKSAYRDRAAHGSKQFENEVEVLKVKKMLMMGTSHQEIEDSLGHLNAEDVKNCIKGVKDNQAITDFLESDKKGKIKLSPIKFKLWLEQNNFHKYFPSDSNAFTFIKVDQNLVENSNEKRIKDFTLDKLMKAETFDPFNFMAERTSYFNQDFLSMLESSDIKIKEDDQDTAYLYYQNSVVKVTKDEVKEIDYIDLDGYVWKNRVVARDFKKADHHDSEFRKFIWLISGQDRNKYNSFKSVIGYLLHSFKTSANNKAIIFNDETISDNPNGGSGKGLFWNALDKMKKVSSIDGKLFDNSKSFLYQTVTPDTQLLVFDDVKRNFSFESLFSLITEGITLEYKGQDAIKLPVEKSPKILITTNYTLGGVGGSFDRRKFEVEMSSYFSSTHTPIDEFGHMLFDDWSKEEWLMFDNYMIECLQLFLSKGLVSHDFKNLEVRKFIKNTSHEFYEWTQEEDSLILNQRYFKKEAHQAFIEEYPDLNTNKFKLPVKRFVKWIKEYADHKGLEFYEDRALEGRWFKLSNSSSNREEEESKKTAKLSDVPF